MASYPTPSRSRPSILRFDLASVFLSGTLNSFKSPQLVLKAQNEPAPRVPYTGSRSQTLNLRYLLMVHVKDKANELEMLDLAAFVSPPPLPRQDLCHSIEYLASECSLVFRYPKGISKSQCTLKIKFKGPPDVVTVLTELWALNIKVQNATPSGRTSLSRSQEHHNLMSPSTQYPTPSRNEDPRLLYGRSSPLSTPSNTQDWKVPFLANPAYQLALSRSPSQLPSQSMSPPTVWPLRSPINQPPRAATSIGIPGVLGEGIYKVSRVSSAPGTRSRARRTSRHPEFLDPRLYTVSKHFDKTLERADIVHSSRHHSADEEGTPSEFTEEISASVGEDGHERLEDELTAPYAHQKGETVATGSLQRQISASRTIKRKLDDAYDAYRPRKLSARQGLLDVGHASKLAALGRQALLTGPASREKPASLDPNSQTQSKQSRGGVLPQRVFAPVVAPCGDLEGTQPDKRVFEHQDRPGTGENRVLLETFQLSQDGLSEATKIWNDLIEKGRREAELVSGLEEMHKIWSKYGQIWQRQLDTLTATVASKMRNAGGGNSLC